MGFAIGTDSDLMPGEKNKEFTICTRFYRKIMQSNPGQLVGILFCAFLIGFLVYYGTLSNNFLKISKDRTEEYRVKIMPNHLNDAQLDALGPEKFSYLAMIDAGSSGCRAHVYRYGKLGEIEGPLYVLPKHNSKKVKPGLSSFAKAPAGAGPSLKDLVEFVKSQVPESAWQDTPIWLKATAGLRMLEKSESDAILQSVREFLGDKKNSPFLFRNSYAAIISGNEEGGFGWVAYNYLKKIIGPKKLGTEQPYAVVEMGGASSQVSQLAPDAATAKNIPKENLFSFTVEDTQYDLYTHSYLGFGGERARDALSTQLMAAQAKGSPLKDPCLNEGYVREGVSKDIYEGVKAGPVSGAAAAGTCLSAIKGLFSKPSNCPIQATVIPTTFNCVSQPDFVTKSANFLVFENFFYVASAIKTASSTAVVVQSPGFPLLTTAKQMQEASDVVCGKNWTYVDSHYPLDTQPKDNLKWCFMSAYTTAFLTSGLGLSWDKTITIQQQVDGADIEWALGAAYKEAAQLLKRTNLRPT